VRISNEISSKAQSRFGVRQISSDQAASMVDESDDKTLYVFDLSAADGDDFAPVSGVPVLGGQLIQATDEFIAVRGARVILVDDDMARSTMTGSWLMQMGWDEVYILPRAFAKTVQKLLEYVASLLAQENTSVEALSPEHVADLLQKDQAVIVDISQSHEYLASHIPGAAFCPRDQLFSHWNTFAASGKKIVLTSTKPNMSLAASEMMAANDESHAVLAGGNAAWVAAGKETKIGAEWLVGETSWLNNEFAEAVKGREKLVKDFVDWELERFFDPKTTFAIEDAMKKYLRWEIDLVDDWKKDGTARFRKTDSGT